MQNRESICDSFTESVEELVSFLNGLTEDQLHQSNDGKWSVAENIIHLNKSVAPINMALSLPKFSFFPFGKSELHYNYDEIIVKYQAKLKEGAVASKSYVPSARSTKISKEKLIAAFREHYNTLIRKLMKWSEKDLDDYRLPHPIIGKITIREMLFFTKYHIQHHFTTMQKV